MPPYIFARRIANSSNITQIVRGVELKANAFRAELDPVMNTMTNNFLSLRNHVRDYSIQVLAPALRRYHEAHVALRQLGGRICFDNTSNVNHSNFCRPDLDALPLDPRPLDWAYSALAEESIISRGEISKHLCHGRTFMALNSSGLNVLGGDLKQTTILNLEILQRSRAQSLEENLSVTTCCVINDWVRGSHFDPLLILKEVFKVWNAAHLHKTSNPPLADLGNIRIIMYGTPYVAPSVRERTMTGQPRFPPNIIKQSFNLTNDDIISAAWANLSTWQTLEHDFAVNERLMNPDHKWSRSLGSWESMGLKYTIFTVNVYVRHPRVFPLPLGAPNLFHSELEQCRYNIRMRETDYKKKRMLLLNFKPCEGDTRSSTSERQAIYRLAALGDPETGVKPWTFANILPSKGDHLYKTPRQEMNHHYNVLASSHFVLSPRGTGLDCYRTWEALALGTIPIVKKSGPFDAIYEGLPVLLVSRWEEVTLELLEKTLQEWRHRRFPNLKRISVAGWLPESA